MSLINEALKKAQRQRLEGAAASAPSEGDGPIAKRAQPKSAHSMFLLAVGAVVLVVASMVGTAFWLTRPSSTGTNSPAATRATPAITTTAEPLPAITAGITTPTATAEAPKVVAPIATTPSPAAAPTPKVQTSAVASSPAAVVPKVVAAKKAPETVANQPAPAPATTSTAIEPAPAPEAPVTAKPDERIHQFVESLKVTGIRSSGTDSKVLMNDRVYRVNDIVDRGLGVRLTKVAPDSLTFTDANGATYVKYF